jgi:DNA-binding NarL/FixJ family response regulator
MLRIALIDDHPIFRSGLRAFLDRQRDLVVVAEWSDAVEAARSAADVAPDLFIVDVRLPGGDDGISLARKLVSADPDRRVLVLSMYEDAECALRAFSAGALGYALKTESTRETLKAVRSVGKGGTYLSRALADRMWSSAAALN